MNSGTIIIIALISFFVLIFWVIPKFYKRKIESVFMNSDSTIIYLLTNAKSSTVSKTGIYDNHRIFFNKVDITTGQVLFTTKIKSFTTKMLDGYARIIGINGAYTFITMTGNWLFVIDNQTGQIVLNHKQLIRKNPSLKNFENSNIQYDFKKQTIILFDVSGYGYFLNVQQNSIERITQQVYDKPEPKSYRQIDPFHLAKLELPDVHDIFREDWRFKASNETIIFTADNPGSKRKFVLFGNPKEEVDTRKFKHDFLHPQILKSGVNQEQFIDENSFLILHVENEKPTAKDYFLSKMNKDNSCVWTKALITLMPSAMAKKNAVLFFEIIDNKIYLFNFVDHIESNKMQISCVDLKQGIALSTFKITL